MKQEEKLTLQVLKRKLEIQKPRTVDGLCQVASALALLTIAERIEYIAEFMGDIESMSVYTGSIVQKLGAIDHTLDGIDDRLIDIKHKYEGE